MTTTTTVSQLLPGDEVVAVLTSDGWKPVEGERSWTVDGVQCLGAVTIVDFTDSTATPPVPSNGCVEVKR